MQEEERNVGAVTWSVYKKYLENAGGLIWAPVIAALLITVEGNNGDLKFLPTSGSHSNVLASFYNVILGILERKYSEKLHARRVYGCLWSSGYVEWNYFQENTIEHFTGAALAVSTFLLTYAFV
jgi:hypothetical protein